jgi:cell wall-associated NlpC family hydrolase
MISVDVVALAKSLVNKGQWKWAARSWDAPDYFDCSSFTKWLYAQKGIKIPRRARQQYGHCRAQPENSLDGEELRHATPGDLLFVSSPYARGTRTAHQNNLHVGLVVPEKKIICATNSEFGRGVVEVSFKQLFKTRAFRGIGSPVSKYYADDKDPVTLITPREREIETSEDVYESVFFDGISEKNFAINSD